LKLSLFHSVSLYYSTCFGQLRWLISSNESSSMYKENIALLRYHMCMITYIFFYVTQPSIDHSYALP
jgi:hypothetical protein